MMNKWCVIACILGHICLQASTQSIHSYLWANYHQFDGNTKQAHSWYKSLLNDHCSIYTLKGFIHFLAETNNFESIIPFIAQVSEKFKNDPDVQLIFARAYLATGSQDKADLLIIQLQTQFNIHPEIALHAMDTFTRRKELQNALAVADKIINTNNLKSNHHIFYFAKAQLQVQLGNPEDALKNIEACIEKHPYFPNGWLLFAILQEQLGKVQQAVKGYSTFLQMIPEKNHEVEQHLMHLMIKQNVITNNTQSILLPHQSSFEKAVIYFDRKQYTTALQLIDEHLAHSPQDTQARLLKITILHALEQYDNLAKQFKVWLAENSNDATWFKTLHDLTKTIIPVEVTRNILEDTVYKNPTAPIPALYLIDFYLRYGQEKLALNSIVQTLPLITDPFIKTTLLFQQGFLYHKQGDHKQAKKALDDGYALGQDFPPLVNLLAHYAAKNKQYAQGIKLIEQALKKDPYNPHFLDTKAAILYKQKKYKEAFEIQHTLINNNKSDVTIMIHYAKIQYALGNTEQAIKHLNVAYNNAHTSEIEKINLLRKRWNTIHHD